MGVVVSLTEETKNIGSGINLVRDDGGRVRKYIGIVPRQKKGSLWDRVDFKFAVAEVEVSECATV